MSTSRPYLGFVEQLDRYPDSTCHDGKDTNKLGLFVKTKTGYEKVGWYFRFISYLS